MGKEKMMKFRDGPQLVYVGMKVFSSNGQGGSHFRLEEAVIEKIGNKLITLSNRDQFYLENGQKKSEYTWGGLYSSKAAYDKMTAEAKVINRVQYELSRAWHNNMTYEQAIKVAEIMNLNLGDK